MADFTIPTNEVTVQPKVEPIGLEDVKANAYVVDTLEDNQFIERQLIPHARAACEELAKRSFITQTRAQYYRYMPHAPVYLRYGPVQSVSSIVYADTDTTTATLASSLYDVDTKRIPARIEVGYGDSWPAAICKPNSVVITYIAGYGAQPAAVPIIYRRCITVLAGHWYVNRDAFACDDMSGVIGRLEEMLALAGRTLEYA